MKEQAQQLLNMLAQDIAANRLVLPSLPEVALRVRQMTADPQCDIPQVEREVAKDAAMAARLVKVANSTAMRRGTPVTSLRQAITNLGLNLVRSMVTQLAILQTMQIRSNEQQMRGFVASSLRISALCHTLASHHANLDTEQAALGGLLHDIGKLPLRDFLDDRPGLTPGQRKQMEQLLHPVVGAMMLRHWQLADSLVQIAREHERILRETGDEQPDYTDIVITANLLHYGTEQGRYSRYAGETIPALEKSLRGHNLDMVQQSTEERMQLALTLIEE